jgi:16S rRNA (adenine1518-N6/adenine1519-N6)-dimethyltransferase
MFVRPKKSLGQHFLNDKNIARKIAESILGEPELVVEIGPGMGVLTKFLIEKHTNFYAIEIDKESVEYLKNSLSIPGEKIISADFLKLDLKKHFPGKYVIIGNFPYNISSQIFFKMLENKQSITQTVCMIQKEVAERISSQPGNKTYGILSVLLQAFYDIKYLFTVNENVFIPPPKVKSAVIRLTRNQTVELDCNEKLFFSVVKMAFNQRRKTLRNSLRQMCNSEILALEIFNKRPEQLGVEEFVYLTQLIEEKNHKNFD